MIINKIQFNELESTNDYLAELAKQNYPEGTLIVAKTQTKGRGQNSNIWLSEIGGLYFSLLIRPNKYLSLLSIMTGTVVADSLRQISGLEFKVKWPNDIIYGAKKISGILVESKFKNNVPDYFIIGCGININQNKFELMKEYRPTSLKIISGIEYDIDNFLDIFLDKFQSSYSRYLSGNSDFIISNFLDKMYLKNEVVDLSIHDNKILRGKIIGINRDGALLVENNGIIESIYSGRVIL